MGRSTEPVDGRLQIGAVGLAAVVVVLAAVHSASAVVVPVAISFIVTVVVAPYQGRLVDAGWKRWLAFVTVLLPTILVLGAVFWALNLSLSAFVADLPSYQPGGEQLLADMLGVAKALHVNLTHLVRVGSVIHSVIMEADVLTRAFLTSIASWTIVLVLTGFMLFEALDYPAKIRRLVRDSSQCDRLLEFTAGLSKYMAILTIGAAITAAGDFAILFALGIPSAILWAALAFLLSYVPSVGAFVIVVPPTIAALLRFGFAKAMLVLVLMLAVDNLVGIVILPRLIGVHLAIAPFWGMLSLVFWGWLLGPAGAILGVPLTMTAKFLLDASPSTKPLGQLMEPLQPFTRIGKSG